MKIPTKLLKEVEKRMKNNDSAHDYEHVLRVYRNASKICKTENADTRLVLTAALLHDIVSFKKSDIRSKTSSIKSSIEAKKILQKYNYSDKELKIISNAIETHSYSKNKKPKTLEGKILQDADRLDALGAIGIARTFAVGGAEKRSFYNTKDAFCKTRKPNDKVWTVDHFYKKLLRLESKMNTSTAKTESKRRTKLIKKFLNDLKKEI